MKFGQEKFDKEKFGNEKFGIDRFGKTTRSKLGKEMRLRSAREKRLRSGREFAVAAPMTAKAARDTAIAGTRFEGSGSAASGCVPAVSSVAATCVP
ncbi:hypothetical protein [Bradyrhizobium sp.]|uniref:hypothetical protein n=1 Tax=Bradyrhizobium sp. TaxID=376 RepID=UPI003C7A77F4